jgi:translation initiation factor IF-2
MQAAEVAGAASGGGRLHFSGKGVLVKLPDGSEVALLNAADLIVVASRLTDLDARLTILGDSSPSQELLEPKILEGAKRLAAAAEFMTAHVRARQAAEAANVQAEQRKKQDEEQLVAERRKAEEASAAAKALVEAPPITLTSPVTTPTPIDTTMVPGDATPAPK